MTTAKAMDGATQYTGVLESDHKIAKEDGGKIWRDQVITTSGGAAYSMTELYPDSGSREMVTCVKPESEITSRAFLASCEGIPVLLRHGASFVDRFNWRDRSNGHLQNIRVSPERDAAGNVQIIGDVHIKDAFAIGQAETNLRGLSVAYTFEIEETDDPKVFIQRRLRANHLALVDAPRMKAAKLMDAESEETTMDAAMMDRLEKLCKVLEQLAALCGAKVDGGEPVSTDAGDPDMIPDVVTQPGKGTPAKRFADLTAVTTLAKTARPSNPVSDDSADISGMISTLQGGGAMNAEDARRCYDNLLLLKDPIARSGDVGMVRSFNEAMTNVKRQLGRLAMQPVRGTALAFDSPPATSNGDFAERCHSMRMRLLGEKPADSNSYLRRVKLSSADSNKGAESDGDYETACARVRERMLNSKP
jgi:hypothetical protein